MLGGAPEAHEVLSKTPRIEILSRAKVCPEAFPIKASGYSEVMAAEPPDTAACELVFGGCW